MSSTIYSEPTSATKPCCCKMCMHSCCSCSSARRAVITTRRMQNFSIDTPCKNTDVQLIQRLEGGSNKKLFGPVETVFSLLPLDPCQSAAAVISHCIMLHSIHQQHGSMMTVTTGHDDTGSGMAGPFFVCPDHFCNLYSCHTTNECCIEDICPTDFRVEAGLHLQAGSQEARASHYGRAEVGGRGWCRVRGVT